VDDEALLPELRDSVPSVLEPLVRHKQLGISGLRNDLAHGGVTDRTAASWLVGPRVVYLREALAQLPWLNEIDFIARGETETILRGTTFSIGESGALPQSESGPIIVRRGERERSVWPICAWLVPKGEKVTVPAIYVRAADRHLDCLPIRNAFR